MTTTPPDVVIEKTQKRRAAVRRGTPRRTTLLVLQPGTQEPGPRQNCRQCRHAVTCWDARVADRHVVLNLLVCRIKQGIDANSATKLFLELVRPKLRKLTDMVFNHTGGAEAKSRILLELESRTIQHVIRDYDIAAIGYPLHYLFGPAGVVMFDARSLTRAIQRQVNMEGVTYSDSDDIEEMTGAQRRARKQRQEEAYEWDPAAAIDPDPLKQRLARGWKTIDDGRTLSSAEHRVLSLMLAATTFSDTGRPIATVFTYLNRVAGLDRKAVGALLASAEKKIRETTHGQEEDTHA